MVVTRREMVTCWHPLPDEPTDEHEPDRPGWLASLGNVNSRPRYPKRFGWKAAVCAT
jgi:hypothetical protein